MRFIITILLSIIPLISNATTYYVSNSGNDLNNGTSITTSWLTLAKVHKTVFNIGDSILFKCGDVFTGNFTLAQSGIPENYIVVGAYGSGAKPIFSAFYTVTNWTNLGGNIWRSNSNLTPFRHINLVSINNNLVEMGRYPKSSQSKNDYITYYTHIGKTKITSKHIAGTNWTGAEAVVRGTAYRFSRARIITQTNDTVLTLTTLKDTPTNGSGFFIQDDIRCCTQQNDWYYDSTNYALNIYSTTLPTNIKVPTIEKCITITGSYIKIENLEFTGYNGAVIYCNSSSYNHITIDNCNFISNGIAAVYCFANYTTVNKCYIKDVNCAVSTLFGNNPVITNNTLLNIGVLPGMRDIRNYVWSNNAIDILQSSNVIIQKNRINNCGYNGIYFYGDNSDISYNYITNFCTCLNDGGAIYTYTGYTYNKLTNVKIHHNICINAPYTGYGIAYPLSASGIYLDLNSAGIEIYNNTIANTQQYGIFITSEGNVHTHHNTVYNASQFQLYYICYDATDIVTTDSIDHNTLVAKVKVSTSDPTNYWGVQKCFGLSAYTGSSTQEAHTLKMSQNYADYNCYARPIDDNSVIWITRLNWGNNFYTLTNFKTYSGQNIHSYGSPKTISDTSQLHIIYNATTSNKKFMLSSEAIAMDGTIYNDSIILIPFTSKVFISNSYPIDEGEITAPDSGNLENNKKGSILIYNKRIIVKNRKIIIN